MEEFYTTYLMGFADGKRKGRESIEKELLQANTDLSDENRMLKKENMRLNNINQRAIRYIEKYSDYNVIPYELYKILKGENDE